MTQFVELIVGGLKSLGSEIGTTMVLGTTCFHFHISRMCKQYPALPGTLGRSFSVGNPVITNTI